MFLELASANKAAELLARGLIMELRDENEGEESDDSEAII